MNTSKLICERSLVKVVIAKTIPVNNKSIGINISIDEYERKISGFLMFTKTGENVLK